MSPQTATATIQQIPLKDIVSSPDNKRVIEPKSEDIKEMAASIPGGGIREPLQVRVDPHKKGKYIVISGHRRRVASMVAGLETVPCIVYEHLDDAEAIDVMSVTNRFRKNLTPNEEAAEVATWMERVGGNAKVIAEKLGQTERWVRTRAHVVGGLIKPWRAILCDKDKDVRFASWTIAHWVQIARLPEHLQAQMHKDLTSYYARPECFTAADLEEQLAKVMHLLSKAKWDLDDETLCPKAGACSKCPRRTGHQPFLWFDTDEQSATGDQCLDPDCYAGKHIAWVARQAKDLKDKHPSLVLVAKEYPDDDEAHALSDGVGPYLCDFDYKPSSKNGKDAVPAMYVNGKRAGTLTYVKLNVTTAAGSRRATGRSTPLKERKMQLDAKRWAQVLIDLRAKVEGASVADLTWKDKIGGLMAAAAIFGNVRVVMTKREQLAKLKEILGLKTAERRQEFALDMLWESFQPTLDNLLTWSGPVTQTPLEMKQQAEWIAELIGVDLKAMFENVCSRKGFTVPKSWAGLNADGTPKAEKKAKKSSEAKEGAEASKVA